MSRCGPISREAARLETVAFEALGRCGACLDAARMAAADGQPSARRCAACGGGLVDGRVLGLVGAALEVRSAGGAGGRLPGF